MTTSSKRTPSWPRNKPGTSASPAGQARSNKVVARGQVFLPPKAATLLLKRYKDAEGEDSAGLSDLSTREQEVLALTAEGFSSREIGQKLFISPKTVDTYRSRIMDKLGLNHRSELVRFALRVGLLKEM